MPNIAVHADIGPSPRKRFLRDWHIAYAEGNLDFIAENVTDDIRLDVVGDKTVAGASAVLEAFRVLRASEIGELVVYEIITHGREGAVNGERRLGNGERQAFCEVYAFKNTKANTVRSVTSYVIRL